MRIRVAFAEGFGNLKDAIDEELIDFPMIEIRDISGSARAIASKTPGLSAEAAMLEALQSSGCNVLVTDLLLPTDVHTRPTDWLDKLKRTHPWLKIVLHTYSNSPALIGKLVVLNICCVVSKSDRISHLICSIFAASAGGRYLSPNALQTVRNVEGQVPFWWASRLSRRETEVIRLYLEGLSVSEIARRVARSVKTISSQKISAMNKLGISDDIELYRLV